MKRRRRDPEFDEVRVAARTILLAMLVSLSVGCDGSPARKANGGAGGASATGGNAGGRGGGSAAPGGHAGSQAGGHAGSQSGGHAGSQSGGHGGGPASGGAGGLPGGAGGSCAYAGTNHPIGTKFPSTDGCNNCTCTVSGIACTDAACPPDAGVDAPAASCAFATDYRYGPIGGNGVYQDHATLAPPASYAYVREGSLRVDAGTIGCAPALPTCETADVLDASDILRDILHADVQAALLLATPPSYGRDDRPVDGTMFQFLRADGRGFLVGSPCTTNEAATCVTPPAGIAKLVADLRALDAQQLKDPSCAALQP